MECRRWLGIANCWLNFSKKEVSSLLGLGNSSTPHKWALSWFDHHRTLITSLSQVNCLCQLEVDYQLTPSASRIWILVNSTFLVQSTLKKIVEKNLKYFFNALETFFLFYAVESRFLELSFMSNVSKTRNNCRFPSSLPISQLSDFWNHFSCP